MNMSEPPEEARDRLVEERKDLSGEALEVWWVARHLEEHRQRDRDFLTNVIGMPGCEVDELLSWDGQSCWELLERRSDRSSAAAIEEAQAALNNLARVFNSRPDFHWKSPEQPGGRITVDSQVSEAFKVLQTAIERKPRPDPRGGNPKHNRSEFILYVAPAVLSQGYTMNACARILAKAFEMAGVESGDQDKRASTIYQTIRNAQL